MFLAISSVQRNVSTNHRSNVRRNVMFLRIRLLLRTCMSWHNNAWSLQRAIFYVLYWENIFFIFHLLWENFHTSRYLRPVCKCLKVVYIWVISEHGICSGKTFIPFVTLYEYKICFPCIIYKRKLFEDFEAFLCHMLCNSAMLCNGELRERPRRRRL